MPVACSVDVPSISGSNIHDLLCLPSSSGNDALERYNFVNPMGMGKSYSWSQGDMNLFVDTLFQEGHGLFFVESERTFKVMMGIPGAIHFFFGGESCRM